MQISIVKTAAGILTAITCMVAVSACGNITTPDTGSSSAASSSTTAGGGGGLVADTGSKYAGQYKAGATATLTAGKPLDMTMGTMDFSPNTLTVAKGTAVTINIKNTSALNHNFSLDAFHVNQNVDAGQSATVTFTPDQAGTYYFYCNVPGHAQAGMVGKLTVQ